MADGFTPTLLEDGIHLDLPLYRYLADPALSGSAFKTLLTDPPAWRWERPDNPLWERTESRPQKRGTAAHMAILEGLPAYEAAYAVAPEPAEYPGALDTNDELKAWLKEHDLKVSGAKAELIARVLEADPAAPIWSRIEEEALRGRIALSRHEDSYVRMLERFVRCDRDLGPLVSDGLPEVSIVWTDNGRRFKARLDYFSPRGICDLKSIGTGPKRGWSFRRHCVAQALGYSYDLQAVHNWRACLAAAGLPVIASGDGAGARVDLARDLFSRAPAAFTWLFVRMGSAPCGIGLSFERGGALWVQAEADVEQAIENHRRFSETCGDGFWMQSEGVVDIDEGDIPPWHWEVAR
jgi:hypothetical protein